MSLIIDGVPIKSIDGLTLKQQVAVEDAAKLGEPAWHDGVVNNIASALPGSPPWDDTTVQSAIETALDALGIDPFPTFGDQT